MDVRRLGEDVLNLRPVFPKWVRGMELAQGNISKVRRETAGKSEHFEWDEDLPGFGRRVRDALDLDCSI
jgi:hypothetical protein